MKLVPRKNKTSTRKLIYSNDIIYVGASEDEIDKIKDKLTFKNPSYENAMKYTRYNSVAIAPYLTYYETGRVDNENYIRVPIGYDLKTILDPDQHITVIDKRLYNRLVTPKFALELRPNQEDASKSYFSNNVMNVNIKGTIQMPTGKGKSILGLYIASQLSCRTLIVVHKDDLVTGWKKDIKLAFDNKVKSGLIKAKSREIGEFLTIATVQTLNRLSQEELNELYDMFGLIIQDECLVGDTIVVKKDGGISFIKDIKDKDYVLGGKVNTPFHRKSDTVKVKFTKGVIEGSPNHPTFCVKRKDLPSHGRVKYTENDFEVKQLKDITNEYLIPTKITIPHVQKNSFSTELSSFLAIIICAGHLDKNGNRTKVNVSKNREFYSETFIKGCNSFGASYKTSNDCRGNLTLWTNDKDLKNYLLNRFNIPSGKKNNIVEVPSEIFYAPLDSIKSFIETCYNCSGDLSKSKSGYRISFNCVSKAFTQGLQMLLRKFSIVANYQELTQKNGSTCYRLICGGYEFNKFMDNFKLIDYKYTTNRNDNIMDTFYIKDYYLSQIKGIEFNTEIQEVYDFEVLGTNTFIANGALTHNCHHCPASSYSITSNFKARYRLGLTATPERSDGLDEVIPLYYGDICYKYEHDENDEDILPVEVMIKRSPIYFNPLCQEIEYRNRKNYKLVDLYSPETYKLQYNEIRLSDIPYAVRPRVQFQTIDDYVVTDCNFKTQVCNDIIDEFHKGNSCVAFFTQKEHVRLYYEYLINLIGEKNVSMYYGDNKDNDEVLKLAEKKQKHITLTTYAKSTEGTNVKNWRVAFLVSSMNNEKNVEQAVGRVRRTKEGKESPAIVYDYRLPNVYSMSSHGKTRDKRYKDLKFSFKGQQKKGMFSRGFR